MATRDENPFAEGGGTLPYDDSGVAAEPTVRRFRVVVVDGPEPGRAWESVSDGCAIGYHPSNDLVVEDPTVSRFHCEVRLDGGGARLRDLDSRNGTLLDGVSILEARLRDGSLVRLGRVTLRFELVPGANRLPVSPRTSFGGLVGASVAMRTTFALLERAAATDFTVLLDGETGTGKGEAAEAIHAASGRQGGRFLVVDCGALPENLLESELFGHEKGAFTGAEARRIGAFEEASGGTIFLDEIGELSAELQPRLLRVLENREIRRLGSNTHRPVDVRVIAATHRDLRAEVNAGRFRHDLYFRLAVLRIPLPPLRRRPDDIPGLVDKILRQIRAPAELTEPLRAAPFLAGLARGTWPGNVRELRNHLERCVAFQEAAPAIEAETIELGAGAAVAAGAAGSLGAPDPSRPYAEARRLALEEFERRYAEALLGAHGGSVAQAAGAAGITRVHIYRLLRRHGLKP